MDRVLAQKLLYLVNDKDTMDCLRAYAEYRYEQQHRKIRSSRSEFDMGVLHGMVTEIDLLINIRDVVREAANAN